MLSSLVVCVCWQTGGDVKSRHTLSISITLKDFTDIMYVSVFPSQSR